MNTDFYILPELGSKYLGYYLAETESIRHIPSYFTWNMILKVKAIDKQNN